MAGYVSFLAGFTALYPVFAQYKPPTRCQTIFDIETKFEFLTWGEIKNLSTSTPFCIGYERDIDCDCNYCNIASDVVNDCVQGLS